MKKMSNVIICHSSYDDKYPSLNDLESEFIKHLHDSKYDYVFERLADGTFNVWTLKRYFIGKVRLRKKSHYLMYMKNLCDSEKIAQDFDLIVEGIGKWEKYIAKYLK